MKLYKLSGLLLTILLVSACGSNQTDTIEPMETSVAADSSTPIPKMTVIYAIVQDEKTENLAQRALRITTDSNEKADFYTIASNVMEEYKDLGLDSMHLYIHAPTENSYDQLKAHVVIAYTENGVAQTSLTQPYSYTIELENFLEESI